jgi:hypothetical protein
MIRKNAPEMTAAGHRRDQRRAAAYGKAGRADGGLVPHLADGGDSFGDESAHLHELLARDPNYDYATFLPIAADRSGGVHWAVPGMLHDMADSMLGTVEGPERALGRLPQYTSLPEQALNLAGGGLLSSFGRGAGRVAVRAAPEASGPLESRLVPAYNPPVKSPRPYTADYPSGTPTDATGRLTADIEGRPLGGRYVAGRRMVGEPDEALSPAAVDAIATSAAGASPQAVAPGQIGRAAAALRRTVDPETGASQYNILVNRTLSDAMRDRVVAHETGHLVDELAGRIPTDDIKTELKQIYNALNTGQERARNLTGPQNLGYKGDTVDRELMAEAIRGYMADPNYLKTVAPKTAARIRDYVNSNPRLAPLIQFNSVGVSTGLGTFASDKEESPMAQNATADLVPQVVPGLVPQMAWGGCASLGLGPTGATAGSMSLQQGRRSIYHPGGFIHSGVAGRTDALPLAVPADSHVIPADVVSGIGEGNSLNGGRLLDQIFHAGPWGAKAIQTTPAARGVSLARGGHGDRVTEILAAGGEYVVRPEAVARYGGAARRRDPKRHGRKSDITAGHDAIDDFILRARRHVIATTRKLPGPVKN